jgi:hypothetical protein
MKDEILSQIARGKAFDYKFQKKKPSEPLFMQLPEGVLGRRLELLPLAGPDPKSGASANFATRACQPPGKAGLVSEGDSPSGAIPASSKYDSSKYAGGA